METLMTADELVKPLEDPEPYRREKPTMDACPVERLARVGIDYATAGTLIDRGVHHLDEALPVGQKKRAELAFRMLESGVDQLRIWMQAKGYSV